LKIIILLFNDANSYSFLGLKNYKNPGKTLYRNRHYIYCL